MLVAMTVGGHWRDYRVVVKDSPGKKKIIMGQSYNICRMQCLIKYDTYLQVRSIIHKTYGKIKKNTFVV